MHSQLRNKELNNQLKSKVMYTIDKEYLKALKKRINGERETLINESCNDNEETLEKNDARIVCLERIARKVQNVLSDMVLLEMAEKVEDNGQEISCYVLK